MSLKGASDEQTLTAHLSDICLGNVSERHSTTRSCVNMSQIMESYSIKGKVNHETLCKTLLSTGVGVQGIEVKI